MCSCMFKGFPVSYVSVTSVQDVLQPATSSRHQPQHDQQHPRTAQRKLHAAQLTTGDDKVQGLPYDR